MVTSPYVPAHGAVAPSRGLFLARVRVLCRAGLQTADGCFDDETYFCYGK